MIPTVSVSRQMIRASNSKAIWKSNRAARSSQIMQRSDGVSSLRSHFSSSQVPREQVSKEQQVAPFLERIFEKFEKDKINPKHADPMKLIDSDLNQLKNNIVKNVTTEHLVLKAVASYYFTLSGKRIRPVVLLLLSRALQSHFQKIEPNSALPQHIQLAEIIEMIHTASIIHDDVIDDATTRRSQPSINYQFGNKLAILSGDYLLARASVSLSWLDSSEVTRLISTVISDLVEGEFMQIRPSPQEMSEAFEYYEKKTYLKTASLIANSCRSVAVLMNTDEKIKDIATNYGRNLGLAFQVVDDMLDFTGSEEVLGKPAAVDLQLGLATAPVLFASQQFPELNPLIQRKFKEKGDVLKARELVHKSDGIEKTRQMAISYKDKAIEEIRKLHPSKAREALEVLAESVITRSK